MPAITQRGFSLIELMIAMALSLLLILLVTQHALFSHRNFLMNSAQQELIESGWAALHFLRQDIQQAAYWGCSDNNQVIHNGSNNIMYSPYFAITGSDDAGINKSDSISILRAVEPAYPLDQKMQRKSSPIQLKSSSLKAHQTALITNCMGADIFTISRKVNNTLFHNQKPDTTGNLSSKLQYIYPLESSVYRVVRIKYELRLSNGKPTLYRQYDTGYAQALLEDIEQMQILYGENTDSIPGPERYLPISQIGNLAQIHSVQITLTVQSNALIHQSQNNNDRLKKTFSTVIPIYNRLR